MLKKKIKRLAKQIFKSKKNFANPSTNYLSARQSLKLENSNHEIFAEYSNYIHEPEVSFKVDGIEAPYVVYDTKLARNYRSNYSISMDLEQIMEYLVALESMPEGEQFVKQSFTFTAIYLYGRCFTSSDGRGTKLDEHILKPLPKRLRDVHDEIMDTRHNYVAHSGESDLEDANYFLIYHPKTKNIIHSECTVKLMIFPLENKILDYIELVDYLLNTQNIKLEKIHEKLIGEIMEADEQELLKRADKTT